MNMHQFFFQWFVVNAVIALAFVFFLHERKLRAYNMNAWLAIIFLIGWAMTF